MHCCWAECRPSQAWGAVEPASCSSKHKLLLLLLIVLLLVVVVLLLPWLHACPSDGVTLHVSSLYLFSLGTCHSGLMAAAGGGAWCSLRNQLGDEFWTDWHLRLEPCTVLAGLLIIEIIFKLNICLYSASTIGVVNRGEAMRCT